MHRIETVSLIGMGALGCSYMSKIAQTVPMDKLRVIAFGERADRYRKHGVVVNGQTLHFPICSPDEHPAPADLLIFTVKYSQLPQAIEDAKNHVGPNTVILSLLNGITSEELIGERYGIDKVLYSYSLGIDATRTGDSTDYNSLGSIPFGEAKNKPGTYSAQVLRVEEFFKRAGIAYSIPEDMIRSLWIKFMLNVGLNQISAVLRAPYGVFHRVEAARGLALSAMQEVVTLSQAENINLTSKDAEENFVIVDTLSPTGKTSMLQDVEAGRKTELDIFGGTVVALGAKHHIAVPVNEMLVRLIRAAEDMAAVTPAV